MEDYNVDNLTNRYNAIEGVDLEYDAAGNLVKDAKGYEYEYDYENRIVQIIDSNSDMIASYAYDAQGRRIGKADFVNSDNSRFYYYNENWQGVSSPNSTQLSCSSARKIGCNIDHPKWLPVTCARTQEGQSIGWNFTMSTKKL